jgi:hypothetical protein
MKLPLPRYDTWRNTIGASFCDPHDVAALEAENAKLRAELDNLLDTNITENNRINGVLAENAKLRERAERAEKVVEALRSLHDGTFDGCCPLCDALREYDAGS